MPHDPLLTRLPSAFRDVPGVAAVVLGGSPARGSAHPTSDCDIGLYFAASNPLDAERLLAAAKQIADDPAATAVTPIGEWGPWIVRGMPLQIARLHRAAAVRVQRMLFDQRESRAAGGDQSSVEGTDPQNVTQP